MVRVRVTDVYELNKYGNSGAVECSLTVIDKKWANKRFDFVMVPYPLVKKGDEFIVNIESDRKRPVFRRWKRHPSRVRHFGV